MRPAKAAALVLMALMVIPFIAPIAAPQGQAPWLSVASGDLAVLARYNVNVSSLNATLSEAVRLYEQGNYSGSELLSLEVMREASEYLAVLKPRPAPWAEAATYVALASYLAASLSFNSTYSSSLRQVALEAYELYEQGNYSGAKALGLRALGLAASYSSLSASAGLATSLDVIKSLANDDVSLLNSSFSGEMVMNAYSYVQPLWKLIAGANITSPAQVVGLLRLLQVLKANASLVQPLLNASLREQVYRNATANISEAYSELLEAEREVEGLNPTYAAILGAMENASSFLLCIKGALALESRAVEPPAQSMQCNITPPPQLNISLISELYGNVSLIKSYVGQVASGLKGVNVSLGLEWAYASLSAALGYLNLTYMSVEQAIEGLSLSEAPSLAGAFNALNEAEGLEAEVQGSPQAQYAFWAINNISVLAGTLGQLLELVNYSSPNLTLSTSIARASAAEASQLMWWDYEALGNLSAALQAYMNGNDGLAMSYVTSSQALAEKVLQYSTAYYFGVGAPLRELVGNLSAYILTVDSYVSYGINNYPVFPSGYMEKAINATNMLSQALRLTSIAENESGLGMFHEANETLLNASRYLWQAVPVAVNLTNEVRTRSPSAATVILNGVATVGELTYAVWSSALLSWSLNETYAGNLTYAIGLAGASAKAAYSIYSYSKALNGTPSLPRLNVTLASAAQDAAAIAEAFVAVPGQFTSSQASVRQLGSWASEVMEYWGNVSRALQLDSLSAMEAGEGNFTAAMSYAEEAESYVAGVKASGPQPVLVVTSLASPVYNLSAALASAAGSLEALQAEVRGTLGEKEAAVLEALPKLQAAITYLKEAALALLQGYQGLSYAEKALNLSEAAAALASEYNLTDFEAPAELMVSTAAALVNAFVKVNATRVITAGVVACVELNSTSYLVILNVSGQYYLALSPSPLSGEVSVEVIGRLGVILIVAPKAAQA
ncbi:MAG: hypothetical protein L7H09_06785 [Acidilobus sp.]|nr:hypothetical protein [Acidilobus sp.]